MKNFFKLTFLVIVFVGAWYCNSAKNAPQINSLILQNIEALADDDESPSKVWCSGRGSVDCPNRDDKVEYVFSGYGLY